MISVASDFKSKSVSISGLDELKKRLDVKSYETAMRNALNKTARDAFNRTKKDVNKQFNIAVNKRGKEGGRANTGQFLFQPVGNKNVNQDGRYGKIYFRGARQNRPVVELNLTSRPFPLFYFASAGTPLDNIGRGRKGDYVVIEVQKGKKKTVKNAFITKLKSGHIGIFRRRSQKRMSEGSWKTKQYAKKFEKKAPFAVREVHIPNGVFMFKKAGIFESFNTSLSTKFPSYFEAEVKKLIDKGVISEDDVGSSLL